MQQQHLAWFAFQIAAAQQRAEVAVADLVQLFGNRREAARLKNADHDAGATLFFRASAFYAKFHKLLLIKEIPVFEGLSSYFFGFVKA